LTTIDHPSAQPALRFEVSTTTVRFSIGLVLAMVLFVVGALTFGPTPPTYEDFGYVALLAGFSTYLILVIFLEYRRKDLVSPLALFFGALLLYFGLSAILYYDRDFFVNKLNRDYYINGILFVIAFTIVFHVTYVLLRRGFPTVRRSAPRPWIEGNLTIAIAVLLLAGWIGRLHIVEIGQYLHSGIEAANFLGIQAANIGAWRFAEQLPDFAGWMAWIHYLHLEKIGTRSIKWRTIAITLLLLNLIYWVPTAWKLPIAQSVIVPFILAYLTFRKLPKLPYMIGGGAFLGVMFPLTYIYRNAQQALLGHNTLSIGFAGMFSILQNSFAYVDTVNTIGANNRLFGRLDEYEVMSGAVRLISEGRMGMRFGTDYFNAIVNLIPRAIWPDKPFVMYGNEFGHLVGMLGKTDTGTSIASTLLGEAYLNFAEFGVVVGALLAAIYYFFFRQIYVNRSVETGRVLYAFVTPTVLYIDSSFALNFSALLQAGVFLFIVGWLVSEPIRIRFRSSAA